MPKPKFSMEFVGFANYGLTIEASIALTPEYDLKAVTSSLLFKDGGRVVTLIFRKSDKVLGRKGYSLKEKWKQESPSTVESQDIKKEESQK